MGCDMVVALGRATVDGHTLFGHNAHRPGGECQRLIRIVGREFPHGESVQAQHLVLPQARQTWTVLGTQPDSCWGLHHGVNEHHLAAGCAGWRSKLAAAEPSLTGTDLVRLVLERCRGARQALDLLADLIGRHGQGSGGADHLFLLADAAEAFVVEAAGTGWVAQQVHAVRAVSDVGLVRQDWERIAPGLSDQIIGQGWWTCDGSKVDFAGTLNVNPTGEASALRRWGRATFLLEQSSGRINVAGLRRVLADHYEGTRSGTDTGRGPGEPVPLCRHGLGRGQRVTGASFITALGGEPGQAPLAWCCFGPPCLGVYFPVFLHATLPADLTGEAGSARFWRLLSGLRDRLGSDARHWRLARERLQRLQQRIDREAEEFRADAAALQQSGELKEAQRLAGLLLESHGERCEDVVAELNADLARMGTPALAATS